MILLNNQEIVLCILCCGLRVLCYLERAGGCLAIGGRRDNIRLFHYSREDIERRGACILLHCAHRKNEFGGAYRSTCHIIGDFRGVSSV